MTNTAKSQLSHFFKNTPSSAFNQFKHLLVLSLLITFSFSARTALGSITTVVTFDSNSRTKVQCVETKATILFNRQTYGLITSPYTGRTWLDRNLGATRTAISSTDAAAYGDLYQWGRKQDGHESRTSGTTSVQKDSIFSTTDKFITGSFDWVSAGVDNDGSKRASVWIDGEANDICPVGFNVPTKMDLENEMTLAGIDAPNTLDKAFSSFLRIPAAGFRNRATGGAILNTVSLAALWTRNASVSTGGVQQAKYLSIDRTGVSYNSLDRAYGFSVRCIQTKFGVPATNDPVDPSTQDIIMFKGEEYKTIISSSPTGRGRIWLDRNLGATKVATSKTDTAAYGTYYGFGEAVCPLGFGAPSLKDLLDNFRIIDNDITNTALALSSVFKFSPAGKEKQNGDRVEVGEQVRLWSKQDDHSFLGPWNLRIRDDFGVELFEDSRNEKMPVRCVKDLKELPEGKIPELETEDPLDPGFGVGPLPKIPKD
jgi:uncharacterized protein (TIGR02145 family)